MAASTHTFNVGIMQPWRCTRMRSRALRESLHALVEQDRVLVFEDCRGRLPWTEQ